MPAKHRFKSKSFDDEQQHGSNTTNDVPLDTTKLPVDWTRLSITLALPDPALDGQTLQVGLIQPTRRTPPPLERRPIGGVRFPSFSAAPPAATRP